MQRLCCLGYRGDGLKGVAPQPQQPTLGGIVLPAVHRLTGQTPYAVSFGSRTDARFLAQNNYLSFRLRQPVDAAWLQVRLRPALPAQVTHFRLLLLPRRIWARALCCEKTYVYTFAARPGLCPRRMQQAAHLLVGQRTYAFLQRRGEPVYE